MSPIRADGTRSLVPRTEQPGRTGTYATPLMPGRLGGTAGSRAEGGPGADGLGQEDPEVLARGQGARRDEPVRGRAPHLRGRHHLQGGRESPTCPKGTGCPPSDLVAIFGVGGLGYLTPSSTFNRNLEVVAPLARCTASALLILFAEGRDDTPGSAGRSGHARRRAPILLAGKWPGMDWQSGFRVPKVALEHGG
jgi:hypothetical protein